jgi:hypothetical protein
MSPRAPRLPRSRVENPVTPPSDEARFETDGEERAVTAPPSPPGPPEFLLNYKLAWDRCLKAWPLFLVQGGYILLTVMVFVALAFLMLGPVLARVFRDFPRFDFTRISADYWAQFLTPGYLTYFILLGVIAFLWFMILGVLIQGGMMGAVWRYVRGASVFSFRDFVGDMASFFWPILGYQTVWLCVMIVPMGVLGVVVALAIPALKGAGAGAVVMAVLGGLGLLLILLPVAVVAGAYLYLGLAHLTAGRGVMESFRRAWVSFRAQGWRWLWLYLLYSLGTGAALMAVGLILGLLEMIPILGLFFTMFRALFQMAASVLLAVYLPVLTVTYLHENDLESSETPHL